MWAVGYDTIDVPACTERNVAVTNTPGVLGRNYGERPISRGNASFFFHYDLMAVAREWSKVAGWASSGA